MANYSNDLNSGQTGAYGVADGSTESSKSGVFWSAIFVGAASATAVTLALTALGAGLGFAFAPNPDAANYGYDFGDHPVAKFTVIAAIWLLVTQWLSSALGGYLAGRMRTKWVGLHTDEVFFRDTAHGFASWAVSTILIATFATSAVSGIMNKGADMASGAMVASSADEDGSTSMDPTNYYVDRLYRTGQAAPASLSDTNLRSETKRVFLKNAGHDLPDQERGYLARLVQSRTDISAGDARARVDEVVSQMNADREKAAQATEDAKKAATRFALFTFLAMLVGAFIASAAAALGGIHRDDTDVVVTNV